MRNKNRAWMLFLSAWIMAVMPIVSLAHSGDIPQDVDLIVETVERGEDGKANVSLLISNCLSVDSLSCDINYDADALKLISVENGDVFPREYTVTNPGESGRIRLAAISAEGLSEEGAVINVSFEVRGSTGSCILVTNAAVTTVDAENGYAQLPAYIHLENGGVTVNGELPQAAAVTPWIPETPVPAATLEPSAEPVFATEESLPEEWDPIPEETAEPLTTAAEEVLLPENGSADPFTIPPVAIVLIIAFILIVLAIIALLAVNAAHRRKKRKRMRTREKNVDR